MKKHLKGRIGLSLLFSIIVFVIFLITIAILVPITFFIVTHSEADINAGRLGPHFSMILLMISSIVVGTVVSFWIGHYSLKPIQKVVRAMNQLSQGDFSTRLEISYPAELQEVSDSFNRMAKDLGSIELLRTDFVNNFSHEFKTPIVSIKGFAEILKYDDLSTEERNEYLDIVISESKRLSVLATNVLQLSKIENQTILSENQPFDLSEQIRRCILLFESQWENKKIFFSVELQDVICNGNEDLLSQVWVNLLDNAIKFTPKNGNINISLSKEENQIKFTIQDSGCGIDNEAIGHIFDNFYQADTSHATLGNGLGLTVAHKIILLHEGTITCSSQPDVGTEFNVFLPYSYRSASIGSN